MDEGVVLVSKSNPTKIVSPAPVLWGKETENELADPGVALAAVWTKEVEFTLSVRGALPVPPLLVALTVTLEVPAEVGVPEMRPETVLTESPVGSPEALKLVGELVAVIW